MNVPTPFVAVIEVALNRVLETDAEVRDELLTMQGKVIRLVIAGLDLTLNVIPGSDGIQVSSDEGLEPDVTIYGPPFALLKTAMSGDRSGVQEGEIRFEGDVYTGEKFQKVMQRLEPDWEEPLSRLIGDVAANQVGSVVRSGQSWLKGAFEHLLQDTAEYLQEESRDVPAPAEADIFYQSVDRLRDDAARLAARIRKLERKREEGSA